MVTSAPARSTLQRSSGSPTPFIDNVLADRAIEPRRLQKHDGIGIADGRQQEPVSAGDVGITTLSPGIWANMASGLSE
jgi:hypothetical protein